MPDLSSASHQLRLFPWFLHEQPTRRLDPHVTICPCRLCERALVDQAKLRPRTPVCLKTDCDRVLVDLALFCEAKLGAGLESLLYVKGDRIREYFVPVDQRDRPRDLRWWSLTCHEDDELLGRRHQRRRRPRRESVAARAARDARAGAPALPPLAPPRPLNEVIGPDRLRLRSVIAPMAEWALRSGRSVSADVVALLLVAFEDAGRPDPYLLTRSAVHDVLSTELFAWLRLHDVGWPDHVPETMWAYLDFLYETDRLHPDSDPLHELRHPLRCYCGLDAEGRPAPETEVPDGPCSCYLAYLGPTHGELQRAVRARGS